MARKTDEFDLADQLRRAIAESGLNRLQVAKRAGLYYSVVHGFMNGSRDLYLASATKLCRLFDLELRPARRGKRKG